MGVHNNLLCYAYSLHKTNPQSMTKLSTSQYVARLLTHDNLAHLR